MLSEKSPAQAPAATSYSFEQLLNWFGRFTPQFKFRLQTLRRGLDLQSFDRFVSETLTVFRSLLVDLARVPKGAERARRVYALIDEEFHVLPASGVSCAAGCSACCKSFPKQITDDEADLLASLVKDGTAEINFSELERQASALKAKNHSREANQMPCLFLKSDNRCGIYADRPSVCRKYHVVSPREACESETDGVVPRIDIMPELIVSAAMSLPDNGIGMMPEQLAKRLLK